MIYIRVKRKKSTYFVHCDPDETILEVKAKLQTLSDSPIHTQRLILLSTHQVLDDARTLAQQKVGNDAIIAMTLRKSILCLT
ncbi:hypothetical protein KP509_34G025100 [Ceratopteris richardii]|uniref:Ubiquitin-like domain-containing protein n=1 Tax=Ceratopteris richardii TaxID=49495 RepID=A0A8T2QJJ8_CERRI|nr:hypothetical protein KP509_34G025100 [Ceratopteris richardii]KAH7283818.1 hypothetical protein KP509_34G025100 [Ceratopteris richardii]